LGRAQSELCGHERERDAVVKTTMPSKNFPAAASPQMSHCIEVMGECRTGVASAQTGVSSM
jgi:hypothetical protein